MKIPGQPNAPKPQAPVKSEDTRAELYAAEETDEIAPGYLKLYDKNGTNRMKDPSITKRSDRAWGKYFDTVAENRTAKWVPSGGKTHLSALPVFRAYSRHGKAGMAPKGRISRG